MSKKKLIFLIFVLILLAGGASIGPIMSNVETPKYKILTSKGNIEVRRYSPLIIAEVEVYGDRRTTIGDGFRVLADYIFGNNAMETKIEMTAPVQQKGKDQSWKINFVMPSNFSLKDLPTPIDKRVRLKTISERHYAVIKFTGRNSDDNISYHEKELKNYFSQHYHSSIPLPIYAFYNPPRTLPFLRRNEILIEIPH